jgi:hypothetical protein
MQVPIILKLILNMFSCNFFICFSWIETLGILLIYTTLYYNFASNVITVSFLSLSLCFA